MTPTIRLVVITALRDRLIASLLGLLAVAFSASAYLGSGAILEQREMTVVYAAGAARALIALGLIVFTAFHIERLYETREIEAILSRAVSRERFVLSYWGGLVVVSCCFLVPVAAATFFLGLSHEGAVYWVLSVFCETLIVLAFTLFCGLILERAIPTIFTAAGFYGLARLIGFFYGIANHAAQSNVNLVANPILDGIFMVLPRLDLIGQTQWLIYGPQGATTLLIIVPQTIVYVALLLLAAMFDLRHKHF